MRNLIDELQPPIAHVNEDDLQLFVLGRLGIDQESAIEAHVMGCPDCKDKLTATTRFVAQLAQLSDKQRARDDREMRREPRFHTHDRGVLQALAPLSMDRSAVRILDISKNGLGLLLPISLDPGTVVQVRFGQIIALGEVRYCRPFEDQFQAGIRLQNVTDLKH